MNVKRMVEQELDLDIVGATLLSVEEAMPVPRSVRTIGDWWWLRSPGSDDYDVAFVYELGCVFASGCSASLGSGCVRPALRISNLKFNNINIGDKIEVKDMTFKVISDTLALIDKPIGRCAFRKDCEAPDANEYEKSDVKKFVDEWFNELIN